MDDLCLEQPDHALGEGVIVAFADAANGRIDAGFREPLDVADADVPHPSIAMMDEALSWAAGIQDLPQGIENECCCRVATDPPADDPSGEDVDHKGHMDEAGSG